MLKVSEITNSEVVREFLMRDRDYSAYAIGDLEPPYAQYAVWYGAMIPPNAIDAIALSYSGLDPEVLFLMGSQPGIEALLHQGIGAERVYFTAKPDIQFSLEMEYRILDLHQMFRMRVTPDGFTPGLVTPSEEKHLVPLDTSDSEKIIDLQRRASEADGREWHDIAFAPAMLSDGFYFGILQHQRLVAVAGTHIIAPQAKMAAVGNVVVDPHYRRRGLGALVSQMVTYHLLESGFDLIVLNVRQSNVPAIATYQKLGYQIVEEFIEGVAARR